MPFDAMVELAGELGPSFEAQAVNVSEEGMSFRTAYLPETGQAVMCRFDAGNGMSVTAAGEVVWRSMMGDGGEFGIRFTNLDGASTVALHRILGITESAPTLEPGHKVRLHIEGLAAPMRARVRETNGPGAVTAYTELGFLRMDRALQLEDAESHQKRPVMIDRVELEVDGSSKVPQLVFGLRYDDVEGRQAAHSMSSLSAMEVPVDPTPHDEPPAPAADGDDVVHDDSVEPVPATATAAAVTEEEESSPNKLKQAMKKITPAISSWATRAKTAAALVAAKARRREATGEDVEIPVRRTTAPAPGGGLHAEGRKVVRATLGSIHEEQFEEGAETKHKLKITKKKAAIASAIGIAVILLAIAMKKPAAAPALTTAPPAETTTPAAVLTTPPATPAPTAPTPPPNDPLAAAAAVAPKPGKPGKATPFTNGPVGAHPNTIKMKMDGPIESIQGATQPAGFTIVLPNRKSLDPDAVLTDKDARLAGLNVSNEPNGAELTVTFKDGVPNYLVRAKGDTLELVLAGEQKHADRAQAHETKKKAPHGNRKH